MVRSPLTFEISMALNFAFHCTTAIPSRSGTITSAGRSAIARRRNRTDRPLRGGCVRLAGSNIPSRAFAVDGLARNPESSCSFFAIAAGFFQHAENMVAFHVLETVLARWRFLDPVTAE